MKRFLPIILFVAVAAFSAAGQDKRTRTEAPADFKGDGCTLFPDFNYGDCCFEHDKDYFRGGSAKERRKSDLRLYRCVRSKKGFGNKLVAPLMLAGVRVFGVSFLPTPFRWGFGQEKRVKKIERNKNLPASRKNPSESDSDYCSSEVPISMSN